MLTNAKKYPRMEVLRMVLLWESSMHRGGYLELVQIYQGHIGYVPFFL